MSAGTRALAGVSGLSAPEVRVLGCLLEKQRTTPDAYPLSLNALRLAANQSTNREPVVEYDDAVIREALHRLERRGLVRMASGAGSRAAKYRHLLAEQLPLDASEQAVMCVLMLRGEQTPGELKQRTERLHPFVDLASVQATLGGLIERGLVARLDRRPGHKEERYTQLLAGGELAVQTPGAQPVLREQDGAGERRALGAEQPRPTAEDGAGQGSDDVAELRERVARLEREVAELRGALAQSVGNGDPL